MVLRCPEERKKRIKIGSRLLFRLIRKEELALVALI